MTKPKSASKRPQKSDFPVAKVRAGLLVFFASTILLPGLYQPFLTWLWQYLIQNPIYRSSTFETFWTVFIYAAIEVPLTVAFMKKPEWRLSRHSSEFEQSNEVKENKGRRTKPKGMRRPARRGLEALIYVAPLLTLDLLTIKKFGGVPLEDMLVSGNYDPSILPEGHGGHKATFLVPSVHNITWSSPLQTQRALPSDLPTSRRIVTELAVSLVLYDALFFLFHLAMHVVPGLKTWHKPHHSHGEMHPQITNQLHIFERLGLVLLANFSLNIIGSHVLTRTLFVPLFVWLLVEIHCGLDLPWGYEKILPSGWGGGARKHARHHREGELGFEPYFEWCDSAWNMIVGS